LSSSLLATAVSPIGSRSHPVHDMLSRRNLTWLISIFDSGVVALAYLKLVGHFRLGKALLQTQRAQIIGTTHLMVLLLRLDSWLHPKMQNNIKWYTMQIGNAPPPFRPSRLVGVDAHPLEIFSTARFVGFEDNLGQI
jgi:hypothetical protein